MSTETQTVAQATAKPDVDSDERNEMLREAEDILTRIEVALGEIDSFADDIDDCIAELCLLDGFPEDAEYATDQLRYLDLTSDLAANVRNLRREIIAAANDDNSGESGQVD